MQCERSRLVAVDDELRTRVRTGRTERHGQREEVLLGWMRALGLRRAFPIVDDGVGVSRFEPPAHPAGEIRGVAHRVATPPVAEEIAKIVCGVSGTDDEHAFRRKRRKGSPELEMMCG